MCPVVTVCEHDDEHNGSIKDEQLLEPLSNYQLSVRILLSELSQQPLN
jgi:hypothetical protein